MKTIKSVNRLATNGGSIVPAQSVEIPKLRQKTIHVDIIGKSPLIVHAWSAKAVRMMLDKQTGKATAGREKKNPVADFKGSLYYLPNKQGFGLPAPSFKAAIVSAANDVDMKMTEVKRGLHVNSYLVKIESPALAKENFTEYDNEFEKEIKFEHEHGCQMRMDMVRLESGVADIRFRGCFPIWKATLEIEYNEAVLSAEQVVNLISAAGYGCGVGEWRPSSPNVRSGEFGRFSVVTSQ
jgi:hypothetical protein